MPAAARNQKRLRKGGGVGAMMAGAMGRLRGPGDQELTGQRGPGGGSAMLAGQRGPGGGSAVLAGQRGPGGGSAVLAGQRGPGGQGQLMQKRAMLTGNISKDMGPEISRGMPDRISAPDGAAAPATPGIEAPIAPSGKSVAMAPTPRGIDAAGPGAGGKMAEGSGQPAKIIAPPPVGLRPEPDLAGVGPPAGAPGGRGFGIAPMAARSQMASRKPKNRFFTGA